MITVEINGNDRTALIKRGSLRKEDNINDKKDSLKFTIRSYEGNIYVPEIGEEIEVFEDGNIIFGGVIVRVADSIEGSSVIVYDVECTDYSHYLDRNLVVERYESMTVNAIIADIIANYATDFTDNNVDCPVVITTVTFNRITVSEAIKKLSQLTNYSWYVDYDQDIHFFSRSAEAAPFNLTDTSDNYIFDSLELEKDLTQIRNRVFVQGGEIEGTARTEVFSGDGTRKQFPLTNKYAEKPTVTVGGVSKVVGVDFLDDEAGYDVAWNYNEKYIRFKDTAIPADGTNNISVNGVPLFNLVMRVEDIGSIDTYGVYEYAVTNKTIKSREEAKQFAIAQLEAYSDNILEGGFETYTSGLRSGQIIHIQSDLRGIDEDFLIQKVVFTMLTPDVYKWDVSLATLRTVGIVDFLISLIQGEGEVSGDEGDEVLEKTLFQSEIIDLDEDVVVSKVHNPMTETVAIAELALSNLNFGTMFVAGPYTPTGPTDTKRVFVADSSPLG